MTTLTEEIKPCGFVQGIIDYKDGRQEIIEFHNQVLTLGRNVLAATLTNEIGDGFNFYINRMLFGNGGTADGSVKVVSSNRNGLFGLTVVSKPVISNTDPNIPSMAIFTSVIANSEGNGSVLNEMALQLATGDFYSMATFPDLTKTSQMQITWNWRLSFV